MWGLVSSVVTVNRPLLDVLTSMHIAIGTDAAFAEVDLTVEGQLMHAVTVAAQFHLHNLDFTFLDGLPDITFLGVNNRLVAFVDSLLPSLLQGWLGVVDRLHDWFTMFTYYDFKVKGCTRPVTHAVLSALRSLIVLPVVILFGPLLLVAGAANVIAESVIDGLRRADFEHLLWHSENRFRCRHPGGAVAVARRLDGRVKRGW